MPNGEPIIGEDYWNTPAMIYWSCNGYNHRDWSEIVQLGIFQSAIFLGPTGCEFGSFSTWDRPPEGPMIHPIFADFETAHFHQTSEEQRSQINFSWQHALTIQHFDITFVLSGQALLGTP